MKFVFDDDKPIYKQLVDQLKIRIVTGEYQLGERIPSVRDLSMIIKVNPNTIQRALLELENDGLINTKRTSGKFVTTDKKKIEKVKEELSKESIKRFLADMKLLNLSKAKVIRYLEEIEEDL